MLWWWRLIRGGALRDRRAETLGIAAGVAGVIKALADWAVGDLSALGLVRAMAENWALIAGGFGLATLAAKIERQQMPSKQPDESVAAIAEKALRR
jgi:hypothetical protein